MPGYVRADARREQLLGAAREVLVREGLDRLTLRGVAAQAGVHLSTVQYIYPSRAELVSALAQRVMADSGAGTFQIGGEGLAVELERVLAWYSGQLLADPGVRELVRFEFLATAGRLPGDPPIEYPLGRPLMGDIMRHRLVEICEKADEVYRLPPEDLAWLWSNWLIGLLYQLLQHGDLEQFRQHAQFAIERIVEVAGPRPRT